MTYGESTSTPGAATTDLAVVAEEVEGGLVAEGNVDDAVVGEGAHGSESGALLSTNHRKMKVSTFPWTL